jgi:carboxyl-terminal processing protease
MDTVVCSWIDRSASRLYRAGLLLLLLLLLCGPPFHAASASFFFLAPAPRHRPFRSIDAEEGWQRREFLVRHDRPTLANLKAVDDQDGHRDGAGAATTWAAVRAARKVAVCTAAATFLGAATLAPWGATAFELVDAATRTSASSGTAAAPSAAARSRTAAKNRASAATASFRAPSVLDDQRSLLVASSEGDGGTPAREDDADALDEVWTLVDKYYVNKASNQNWDRIRATYRPRFEQLRQRSASTEEQLKVVEEMVATLGDKYSRILTPSQYSDIQKFDLLGVGVTLMPNQGRIVVGAPPIEGSASARAGLKAGDVILKVNGVPTEGRTALDIIDQISERPDARTLTFLVASRDSSNNGGTSATNDADANNKSYEVTLDRTLMDVRNPIQYQLNVDRDGLGVGYVRIDEFNSMVLPKLEEALDALSAKSDLKGLVLDLRQNTGGAFQSAVEIASLFVPDRVAIYVVDNTDQTTPFRTASSKSSTSTSTARDHGVDPAVPVVIWMDGRTASASEVLAASLHDNCRAVLAGGNSFGKGLIQAVYGLKNGGGMVLTVARYVSPAGNSIQGSGIAPDIPGHVSPTLLGIPVSADTSSVDWSDVRQRLAQCQPPVP